MPPSLVIRASRKVPLSCLGKGCKPPRHARSHARARTHTHTHRDTHTHTHTHTRRTHTHACTHAINQIMGGTGARQVAMELAWHARDTHIVVAEMSCLIAGAVCAGLDCATLSTHILLDVVIARIRSVCQQQARSSCWARTGVRMCLLMK